MVYGATQPTLIAECYNRYTVTDEKDRCVHVKGLSRVHLISVTCRSQNNFYSKFIHAMYIDLKDHLKKNIFTFDEIYNYLQTRISTGSEYYSRDEICEMGAALIMMI